MRCEREKLNPTSHPCCDVCDPDAFRTSEGLHTHTKPTRKRKVHANTILAENMDGADVSLKNALHAWRVQELKNLGFGGEDFFGPQFVMSERVLQRVVELAHDSKIASSTSFIEQVQWCDSAKYADEIMGLVRSVYPINLPKPLTVLSSNSPLSQVPPSTQQFSSAHNAQGLRVLDKENNPIEVRQRRCGKCKKVGHIGM